MSDSDKHKLYDATAKTPICHQALMLHPKLNWLDKAIWAVAKLVGGEMSSTIYVMKVGVAGSLCVNLAYIYRILWKVFDLMNGPPPFGELGLVGLLVLCYVPVHFATHSAQEIESADLSEGRRWGYTILGIFIVPLSWMLLGFVTIWLESGT